MHKKSLTGPTDLLKILPGLHEPFHDEGVLAGMFLRPTSGPSRYARRFSVTRRKRPPYVRASY